MARHSSTFLLLLCLVLAQLTAAQLVDITQPTSWPQGSIGPDAIYYQSNNPTPSYFTFGNVKNPIAVSITYGQGDQNVETQVCLNSFESAFPVSGFAPYSCPAGSSGIVSNSTAYVPANKMSSKNPAKMAAEDDDSDSSDSNLVAYVYVKPTTGAAFIAMIESGVNSTQNFIIGYQGQQCQASDQYPVGPNNECVQIQPAQNGVYQISNGTWFYQQFYASYLVDTITITANGSKVELYIQEGYYPTQDWFLNANIEDDDDVHTATILTPSYISASSDTYFIGIYNANEEEVYVNFTILAKGCNSTTFGYDCRHSYNTLNDPITGYYQLSAILSNTSDPNANNGTAISFDYTNAVDYTNDYAYFAIANYPTMPSFPYYIRVSVANSDSTDSNGAPAFYAKRGGIPSAQSNSYNASTNGDVTHQILIQITQEDFETPITPENQWFFAVQLPSEFSIWTGTNCADGCADSGHGACYCSDVMCNTTNIAGLYQRPTSTKDSLGSCTCTDDDFDNSYTCSERNNPHLWMWITLISIVAVIAILISVGVPVYCYIQNRKKEHFEVE